MFAEIRAQPPRCRFIDANLHAIELAHAPSKETRDHPVLTAVNASTASSSSTASAAARISKTITWATVAQITAILTAFGGLCLHLMGATYNTEYYRRWGLDAAFFPLATDATLILGYEAFVNGVAVGAVALFRDYRPWLSAYGVCLAIALLIGAWIGYRRLQGKHFWSPKARWVRAAPLAVPVLAAFAVPALAIPYAGMLGVLALALPISTAEHYARQQADSRLQTFKAGCNEATAKLKCTTITRDGGKVVTGFVVGASSTHIAVFDPVDHKVMTIERPGLVLSVGPFESVPPAVRAALPGTRFIERITCLAAQGQVMMDNLAYIALDGLHADVRQDLEAGVLRIGHLLARLWVRRRFLDLDPALLEHLWSAAGGLPDPAASRLYCIATPEGPRMLIAETFGPGMLMRPIGLC